MSSDAGAAMGVASELPALADPHGDPHPIYAELRAGGSVHYVPERDIWLVCSHSAVSRVLREFDTYASSVHLMPATPGLPRPGVADIDGFRVLMACDPPEHTRLRRIVRDPFLPTAIAALGPTVLASARRAAEALVEEVQSGSADAVSTFAAPLASTVIGSLVGMDDEAVGRTRGWITGWFQRVGSAENPRTFDDSNMEMFQYFDRLLTQRRREPRDDLASWFATDPADEDGKLTLGEKILFCSLLVIAGIETTVNLIANLLTNLIEQPELEGRLRCEPALVGAAVEETLRRDPPVHGVFRVTTRNVALDGVELPKGALLYVLIGSANHDEAKFHDGDAFDLLRGSTDHLSFGLGPHYCLGAMLARIEARAALEELLRIGTRYERAGAPAYVDSSFIRTGGTFFKSVTSMPVRFDCTDRDPMAARTGGSP